MISVMANATLQFSNGEETVVANVGFNRLPDWVATNDYYKLCCGGINRLLVPFEGSDDKTLQKVADLEEENEKLKLALKAKEEKAEQAETFENLLGDEHESEEEEKPKKRK